MKGSRKKKDGSDGAASWLKWFEQYQKVFMVVGLIVLVLIPIILSVTFRSYPASLPVADDWAQQSILNNIKSQVSVSVNQQYPHLPQGRRAQLIDDKVAEVVKNQQDAIDEQIVSQAAYIRNQMQRDDGQTYLLAIDPYYYWRQTRNVIDHGYGADIMIGNTKYNNHVHAPLLGEQNSTEYHPLISAGVYKLVRVFNPDADLFNIFFWMPVIISALAVIPAFFITRKKAGNLGGFFASVIIATHATFLGRTAAGFADTDAYNVTFPLLIFWMFLESFEAKDVKRKVIFSALTGIFTSIYARTWGGWWYIFDFMLAVLVVYMGYSLIKNFIGKRSFVASLTSFETKQAALTTSFIFVASIVFLSFHMSLKNIFYTVLSPIKFTAIQNAAKANLWPNVFTTVAELNKASLASIVSQIGGPLFFYVACLGVVITMIGVKKMGAKDWMLFAGSVLLYLVLLTKPLLNGNPYVYLVLLIVPVAAGIILLLWDNRDIDVKYAVFLAIWFAGTIYASTQGVRFILLLVPAYAVALGIFVGVLYKLIVNWSKKQFKINMLWVQVPLIILALSMLYVPVTRAHVAAKNEVPSMNDAWWDSLSKIDAEAAPDAIINSWWDFGHWFKAVADRAVTFDGGSQNTPMAHWIGKALLTADEDEAVGILRMLDCGSRTGFDQLAFELQGVDNLRKVTPETTLETKRIMDELLLIDDRDAAAAYLEDQGLNAAAAARVVDLTHCDSPEDYFITSSDMVGKAGVWGHFGSWDFKKAYLYSVLRKQPLDVAVPQIASIFDVDEKAAGQMYYDVISLVDESQANAWISPWPNYLTSSLVSCQVINATASCTVNANVGAQNGQIIRIEKVFVPLNMTNETSLLVGFYNQQTGQRLGETSIKPSGLVIADGVMERTAFDNSGIAFDVVLWHDGDTYRALMVSPELSMSMFTRLYYLEGNFTERFERFSDERSYLNGDRIIVWKVAW